jgi:dextranase
MTQLLPTRTTYRAGENVLVEARQLATTDAVSVWHLGELVGEHSVAPGTCIVDLGPLSVGGYTVELASGRARTAAEVVTETRSVLRYGFVVDYSPDRDLAGVQDNLRRLHLTGVQFYDWAYRHADLLGGGESYTDALDQPVSLATVRSLIQACHEVGSEALGYAAVYAVGPEEWPKWEHDALLTATGVPYALGDFLFVLDPASPDWLDHFRADLAAATRQVGFDGFHLDQYGYPKRAYRPDGTDVDVAQSFTSLIAGVRNELPEARLVFNNVNDFPTWATGDAPQDAVYVEVWPPHIGYQHLAQVSTRARAAAVGKPVVIAAYQHVYDQMQPGDTRRADTATALTMATLFSHGATHLLCGEADRILVDPYYVRNHTTGTRTAELLARWYDFSVAHAELLFPAGINDVTGSFAGTYNDDIDITYADTATDHIARAGTVWRRITETTDNAGVSRYVMHLINLTGQDDTEWDAPRNEAGDPGPGTLRLRRTGQALPRVSYADPDAQHRLVPVELTTDGDFLHATVPAPARWQIVVIEPHHAPR